MDWLQELPILRKRLVSANSKLDFDPHTLERLTYIGGFWITFDPDNRNEGVIAFAVVKRTIPTPKEIFNDDSLTLLPTYTLVDGVRCKLKLEPPYIHGMGSFRLIPAMLECFFGYSFQYPDQQPQVVLVNGYGVSHPLKFDLARHFGVVADTPTISITKTAPDLNPIQLCHLTHSLDWGGAWKPLEIMGDKIAAIRLPFWDLQLAFVRPGHRVDRETAARIAIEATTKRLPEPLRYAQAMCKHPFITNSENGAQPKSE